MNLRWKIDEDGQATLQYSNNEIDWQDVPAVDKDGKEILFNEDWN